MFSEGSPKQIMLKSYELEFNFMGSRTKAYMMNQGGIIYLTNHVGILCKEILHLF